MSHAYVWPGCIEPRDGAVRASHNDTYYMVDGEMDLVAGEAVTIREGPGPEA